MIILSEDLITLVAACGQLFGVQQVLLDRAGREHAHGLAGCRFLSTWNMQSAPGRAGLVRSAACYRKSTVIKLKSE